MLPITDYTIFLNQCMYGHPADRRQCIHWLGKVHIGLDYWFAIIAIVVGRGVGIMRYCPVWNILE